MPQVPSLSAPRVAPNVSGATIPQTPSPEAIVGDQNQRLGHAMMEAGSAATAIALDTQQIADQVQVNAALNEARRTVNNLTYDPAIGYKAARGADALNRTSGQALPEEYGSKLTAALSGIADRNLKTDAQRRAFAAHADQLSTQFYGHVEGHMLQEFTNHRVSVADGATDLAIEDAKVNWNDPAKIRASLDAAKGGIYDKGKALGWSASQVDAAYLKASSHVHQSAILTALANDNPVYALGYLDRFKSQMTGDDILRVQGHVNQAVSVTMSTEAVQKTTTDFQPLILPNSLDKMTRITAMNESGGRQLDDKGNPVIGWVKKPDGTKVEGGIGFMQVTAKTGPDAAKLAGLPWDETKLRTDEKYNRALGTAYLQERLQKWGDPAKAWAAYNAGDTTVEKALKEVKKDRESGAFRGDAPPDPYDWLQKMPRETQAYVKKNMAMLGSSAATPERPVEGEFVQAALRKLPPGTPPQTIAMTRDSASKQYNLIIRTLDDQANNAMSSGQRWLAENNGDIKRLPPEIKDQLLRLAPGKLDDLTTYAKAFDGSKVETNLALYNRLSAHPEALAAMPDVQFEMLKPQLAPSDFKHFATVRGQMLTGKPGEKASDLNMPVVESTVSSRLRQLRIDPTPKDDGGSDAARVGTIRQTIHRELYAMQAQHGKKFTDAETEQAIDKIFATNVELRKSFMGITTGVKTAPLLTMQIADVPSDVGARLKADFKAMGVSDPTDSQVIGAFQALQLRKRRQAAGGY
jgi:soluble lytic murein transglycosylase